MTRAARRITTTHYLVARYWMPLYPRPVVLPALSSLRWLPGTLGNAELGYGLETPQNGLVDLHRAVFYGALVLRNAWHGQHYVLAAWATHLPACGSGDPSSQGRTRGPWARLLRIQEYLEFPNVDLVGGHTEDYPSWGVR